MARLRNTDTEFPTTLDECIEKFGIEEVYRQFKRMMQIDADQRYLATLTPEEKRKLR
jgi:hypothetical protein